MFITLHLLIYLVSYLVDLLQLALSLATDFSFLSFHKYIFKLLSYFLHHHHRISGWNELWKDNFTPWQQDKVHPKLVAQLETVIKASEKTEHESIRFFVPLCGTTPDLVYLYEKGFQVIGLEGVEKACQEFFDKNKIEFERTEDEGYVFFQVNNGPTLHLSIFNVYANPSIFLKPGLCICL